MTTITLYTADRQLILLRAPVIASGDRARVELQVHTDASWTGYRLTAILFRDGERERVGELALDSEGKCTVPPALLSEPCTLQIGLRGRSTEPDTDADAACRTTSLVRLRIAEGTPAEAGETLVNPTDATADENAVLAGETFYAGDGREARTGTIPTYEEGTPTIVAPYTESDPTVPAWAKAPSKPRYTAAEVGARPDDWTPTAAEVGARPDDWTPTAAEIGARPDDWTPTAAEVGARPDDWTPTETDPTVPDWAKQPNPPAESDPTVPAWAKEAEKPAYAWDEITDKPFTDGKLNASCLPDDIGTGGTSVTTLTSANNLNTVTQCGWYSWTTSAPSNAPTIGTSKNNCYMRVDSHANGKTLTQTVWSEKETSSNGYVRRRIINGTAGEWEWVDPPMLAGVEYRTTERWLGYPVYTQLVNCGRATNNKEIKLSSVGLETTMIRFCGTMNYAAMPFYMTTSFFGETSSWFYATQNRIVMMCGSSIVSGEHYMHCRVWYIKAKVV